MTVDGQLRFDGAHAKHAETQYASPEVVAQRRLVRAALHLRPGSRVLDVGCGPGLLAAELADEITSDGTLRGIDVSDSMLDLARERLADRPWATVGHGRAESIPFEDSAFDAAVGVQVYEYVADIAGALRELHRVVAPGGRVVILDTDWDSLVWNTDDRPRMREVLRLWDSHLAHPRLPEELGYLLESVGFHGVEVATTTFVNRACHEATYSYWLAGFVDAFLRDQALADRDTVAAWRRDLDALAERGRYFFSLTRYAFTAHRRP